jgi:hypothetical protein
MRFFSECGCKGHSVSSIVLIALRSGARRSGCVGVLCPVVRVFSVRVCVYSLSGCADILYPGVRV